MKKVAVIGANGNMGRRYAMILEQFTDCEVVKIDINNHFHVDHTDCDGYIIATPTENHIMDILHYVQWRKPILCEKPISKSILKLRSLMSLPDLDLSMINQYHFLDSAGEGHTSYNYFKTGSDSLYWDCINIIGTARSTYQIENDSLVWKCSLNGGIVDISEMDMAYINNIQLWVNGWRNKEYILPTHMKVLETINATEK
jgi:hypothetical protein